MRQSVLKRGGGLLPLSHMHTPIQIFSKCFLHCSLAQAIFTVSSVSVINLWQKLGSCPGSRASTCFLLGSFLSRPRAENVGSEVADVTGIVKYIRKSVFWHQAPPPNFYLGGLCTPLPTVLLHTCMHYHLKRLCLSFLVCYVHIAFRSI